MQELAKTCASGTTLLLTRLTRITRMQIAVRQRQKAACAECTCLQSRKEPWGRATMEIRKTLPIMFQDPRETAYPVMKPTHVRLGTAACWTWPALTVLARNHSGGTDATGKALITEPDNMLYK